MVSLEQIRKITTEDLLSLGVQDVAYLKDVEVDGSTAVGIFAANGQQLALLPDLILGRVVARIIISEWRAERFPENRAYVLRNTPTAWQQLHRLLSIASEQTAARIQEATRA